MKTVSIAFRNIFRNKRRSAMTILAFSMGAISVLLFGGFTSALIYGAQTNIVQIVGHLAIFKEGFSDYGASNPTDYSFGGYEELEQLIREDPQLKDLVEIVTPGLMLGGIAGNADADASTTFFGVGVVPSERQKMREWNDYGLDYRLGGARDRAYGITDEDLQGGVIGVGMAHILHLCDQLHLPDCGEEAPMQALGDSDTGGVMAATPRSPEPSALPAESLNIEKKAEDGGDPRPKLALLAAAPDGAPNVAAIHVNRAENRGDKALDDSFMNMHLSFAQNLLFGKGEKKVNEILVLLKHTKDMNFARARLRELLQSREIEFEVKDFGELAPVYGQVISLLGFVFIFIALNMGMIVLFTIVNTMSMSVMERVNEIGTMRALGVRRGGMLRQFLLEGCLLGALGATVGSALAMLVAFCVNACGLTWLPTHNAEPIPLNLQIFQNPLLLPLTWLGLVVLAGVSSYIPARKAGRMIIVDALRHV